MSICTFRACLPISLLVLSLLEGVMRSAALRELSQRSHGLQVDLHTAELTVRETLDFGARVQGTGLKAGTSAAPTYTYNPLHSWHAVNPCCLDEFPPFRYSPGSCGLA